ncbi:hypothetical protein T261_5462 [Streptomyces lydicus]|nr:hypothetical protein T261_5462 [Streptomyces lydicus]
MKRQRTVFVGMSCPYGTIVPLRGCGAGTNPGFLYGVVMPVYQRFNG